MVTSHTKTERIDETVFCKRTDHACCRGMAWESPRIFFLLKDGRKLTWHSDNVQAIAARNGFPNHEEMEGRLIRLQATVRGDRVWRIVKIMDL
jgi:hypothetical protein